MSTLSARPLRVRKAAVIGAGVMGAQIAGWLASLGIPCELLDLAVEGPDRSRLAREGVRRLGQMRPPALATASAAQRIRPGNVDDDLGRLRDVDLVIEAIVEDLGAKQALWARVEPYVAPHAVVASNTSGLSVAEQVAGRSEGFRRRFMGLHFFNPPRYLPLVEVIATADTDPERVEQVVEWLRRFLGKRPVLAKDTPNFIGNRVGIFALQVAFRAMQEWGLSVEEVDLVTGPVMGRPKSATFRTLDLVGLDTYLHVLRTGRSRTDDPDERALLQPPPVVEAMVRRGLLGEKAGAGFYRRSGKGDGRAIEVLDWESLEYRPRREARFDSVDRAMAAPPGERLRVLLSGDDPASRFAWAVLGPVLRFCAAKLPEIAYTAADVDAAMRDGFSWEQGPFEVWDRLGVVQLAGRLESEGKSLPPLVKQLLASPAPAFYRSGGREVLDGQGRHVEVKRVREHLRLAALEAAGARVRTGPSATLWDLGDDVAALEMHPPKAAIDDALIEAAEQALSELGSRWRGLVVFNDGPDFSVGANLFALLVGARSGQWDQVERAVARFQRLNMAIKYAPSPVVVAVAGRTLGGGAEMVLHAPAVVAAVESYIGLVETGVGLIPAGGGTKEALVRTLARLPEGKAFDPQPLVAWLFEVIAQATVSTSAYHARELGWLRACDDVIADRAALLFHAKQRALRMEEAAYTPAVPAPIAAPGRDVRAALVAGALDARRANRISDHDVQIARRLAHVMCGGDVPAGTPLTEQALLDLEREAFLWLLGQEKTQQRIEHVLTTGRPLRN
ncbi:3-hydroxyacyl-CoA dehydrogenase/enoyl-CoA hydratase family protein [Carboxydochorda subterranea]|uniref:3-hydroxyacyl-CoA dehydrogenase/enoyl-CoA hydratase family protein n=1 Tax=Carboxydichorda subterranea TaxID=3109565 RepID=A0ABZ1C119_9FIRM|nr:3-hydroxyacyl-CoA dehydrogenase/enoyl-CoA hydratase family protein [Limnochorda sp. L945t]WRP18629.1 3-hydroxyacyl-CoA dehydrogenase/enoyl-CoA hydratase family protein [Limnochorda sp. L945t]